MSTIFGPHPTPWVKSTYSGGNGGQCVEWAPTQVAYGVVPVRDSKTPRGARLHTSPDSWARFVTAIKSGDLDAS
jgi:hypothetical protein